MQNFAKTWNSNTERHVRFSAVTAVLMAVSNAHCSATFVFKALSIIFNWQVKLFIKLSIHPKWSHHSYPTITKVVRKYSVMYPCCHLCAPQDPAHTACWPSGVLVESGWKSASSSEARLSSQGLHLFGWSQPPPPAVLPLYSVNEGIKLWAAKMVAHYIYFAFLKKCSQNLIYCCTARCCVGGNGSYQIRDKKKNPETKERRQTECSSAATYPTVWNYPLCRSRSS